MSCVLGTVFDNLKEKSVMRRFGLLLFVLSIVGCKSTADLTTKSTVEDKTVVEIINAHNDNVANFSTSFIRGTANYNDGKQSQNVGLDIRIKKDEIILINIKVIGLSMAKIQLTPTSVQFYEKLNSRFYDGDFDFLSDWLGTDLDFYKVQNLLLGKAINSLEKERMKVTLEEGMHKLEHANSREITETYYFEDADFMLKKEELNQKNENRSVIISYPNYQKIGESMLPSEIHIEAKSVKNVQLKIRYDKVSLNEDLNFSFSIPSNSKNIITN